MMFREGQKVQCIDAGDDGTPLILNAIYTIRKITPPFQCRWRGVVGIHSSVWLHEVNPSEDYFGFCDQRFKPIDERKTDISIFQRMLVTEKADA